MCVLCPRLTHKPLVLATIFALLSAPLSRLPTLPMPTTPPLPTLPSTPRRSMIQPAPCLLLPATLTTRLPNQCTREDQPFSSAHLCPGARSGCPRCAPVQSYRRRLSLLRRSPPALAAGAPQPACLRQHARRGDICACTRASIARVWDAVPSVGSSARALAHSDCTHGCPTPVSSLCQAAADPDSSSCLTC
ncbi:hypothetical protein DENSPDRAFT_595751 [Dentipellis sp. KUC8613]|nr:hypothetical protein DENSPDRAFT_595751 [Dentipellis sp. KUC8613]